MNLNNQDDKNMVAVMNWCASVPKYAEEFIHSKSSTVPNTLRIYSNNINIFWKWLEEKGYDNSLTSMSSITQDMVSDFIKDIGDTFANATISSIMSTLSSLFTFLIQEKHVSMDNPLTGLQRPYSPAKSPIILTDAEKKKLIHTIFTNENMSPRFLSQEVSHGTRYRNQSLLRLLMYTDMYVSEIVNLNVDDVNFSNNSIFINNGKKSRELILSDDVMSLIKNCFDMRKALGVPDDEPALFVSSQGKSKYHRISSQCLDSLLKTYAIAANIKVKKLSPNKLRKIYLDSLNID